MPYVERLRSGQTYENTCKGKHRHETIRGALAQKTSLVKNRGESWEELNDYKCPFCGKYHVGHNFKARRNRNPVLTESKASLN